MADEHRLECRLVCKIVTDIFIFIAVIVTFVILTLTLDPYRRGYFAEDLTIRLPYKPNTVPFLVLTVVAFIFIISTILITEFIRSLHDNDKESFQYSIFRKLPVWILESYIYIGIFVFGTVCQQLIVDIGKLVIGRLRPHFFDVCGPIPDKTPGPYEYITNYKCSKVGGRNMRLSFPSGHSCFAMYSAVFIILYIQKRIKWGGPKLVRHGIQLAAFTSAWFVCLSRVSDHMHHWDDVAAGILIGAVSAALVFLGLRPHKNRKKKNRQADNVQTRSPGQTTTNPAQMP